MFNIGPAELMVVLLIALIVLGPSKLPDAARQVGRALGEMRKLSSGFQAEMRDALKEPVDGKPSSAGSTAKGGGALSAPNAGTSAGDATTVSDTGAGDVPPGGDAGTPVGDTTTVSDAGPAPGDTVDAPAAPATAAAPAAPAASADNDTTRQSSVGAPAGGAPGEANEPENNGTTPN